MNSSQIKINVTVSSRIGLQLLLFGVALATLCNAQDSEVESGGLQKLTAEDTPLLPGEKIAFFGDSITMQGGFIQLTDKAIKESANTTNTLCRYDCNPWKVHFCWGMCFILGLTCVPLLASCACLKN